MSRCFADYTRSGFTHFLDFSNFLHPQHMQRSQIENAEIVPFNFPFFGQKSIDSTHPSPVNPRVFKSKIPRPLVFGKYNPRSGPGTGPRPRVCDCDHQSLIFYRNSPYLAVIHQVKHKNFFQFVYFLRDITFNDTSYI